MSNEFDSRVCRFLETQMFTVFIDQCVDKIVSGGAAGPTPFDVRHVGSLLNFGGLFEKVV